MTDTQTLSERLRSISSGNNLFALCQDAADTLDAQQAEIEMLRKAADADGFHRVLAAKDSEIGRQCALLALAAEVLDAMPPVNCKDTLVFQAACRLAREALAAIHAAPRANGVP
jgi:hypothetical protein